MAAWSHVRPVATVVTVLPTASDFWPKADAVRDWNEVRILPVLQSQTQRVGQLIQMVKMMSEILKTMQESISKFFGSGPKMMVRTTDPDTSMDAAEKVDSTKLEQMVYEVIANTPMAVHQTR